MPIDLEENNTIEGARIKVIGVGGGGNNAVDRMIEAGVTKAEFICVNTDAQQLSSVKAPTVLQIGQKLTNGLGAGAKPEIGRQAAEETKDEIKNIVKDAEMVFVTAGMGGGTGTGAAPIIAEAAKSLGILTVAVVTKPFFFEGPQRMKNAEEGIKQLAERVDAIVTIPNDLLLKIADKKVTINDSFKLADDVLRQGVQGIIEVITQKGIMNCDFADVRTIMKDSGVAHMGIGIGKGESAAQDAVRAAIESPLLETSIEGAENVLLNITGGSEFSLVDMGEVSGIVREMVSEDANIIVGTAMDDTLKDEIKVTLIATGLEDGATRKKDSIMEEFKRSVPKFTAADSGSAPKPERERRAPSSLSSSLSDDEDSIFTRRRPGSGMSNIDVPSFFKPGSSK
ncbi:MAG TPA: cell division protein FtsZ [Candidatus Ornithomonoglobus intestinigallinarum]|uniref:Cell division protein FtsZ n=1 Tax=Candidatus Ornithomonoglobus intestinigallinarum TaxID=2840894 RepID=A0A9D1H500_9FIRM|nr:cell division protein FtsZ [Candidatus Ornithomonoglobus intestinigallinarum]